MVATRSTTRKALADHSNVSSDGAHGKRVKISEDEIAMSGAPQGVLVQVDVLESSEYTPSEDPFGELALIQASLTSSDWDVLYNAVSSTRRLCLFHPDMLCQDILTPVLVMVCEAVQSLRSTMARNAMLCFRDLLKCLPTELSPSLEAISGVLVPRTGSDKKFIVDTARQTLDEASNSEPLAEVLMLAVGSWVETTNNNAATAAIEIFGQCLRTLAFKPSVELVTQVLTVLSKSLGSKSVEGKNAARKSLRQIRRVSGDAEFEVSVKCAFGNDERAIQEAMDNSKPLVKKNTSRPASSIRERMMAQMAAKQSMQNNTPAASGEFQMCL